MYKALKYFTDLQDSNHPYDEGDIFPRDGLKVSEERLKELSSTNNKRKEVLIQLIEEAKPLTKTEINRMTTAELKNIATDNGIENAEEMTGAELKKVLIAKFDL